VVSIDLDSISRPRPPGSKAHGEVRDILLQTMQHMDLMPYEGKVFLWSYHGQGSDTFANVLGVLPGRDASLPPMILGAHYDSVPGTPGADDNAAAIWVVLNAVGGIRPGTLRRSVTVALFDAEEPPYYLGPLMGSTNFYQTQLSQPVHCAFIFDLVGHDVPIPGIEDLVFITGMESHPSFEAVINSALPDSRIRIVPALNSYVGDMSDHHVFRIHGDPYLFFSCGRWQHYHASTDTPDRLNIKKMEALSAYVRGLLMTCDRVEFSKGSPAYDTTATELKFMNANLDVVLRRMGIYPLRNRKDINKAARALTGLFGL
jgi:hypothetical protein